MPQTTRYRLFWKRNTIKTIRKKIKREKEFLKNTFDAMSCDMESAAVAYVADLAEIPFAALRRISDDAGDDASDSYSEMNNLREEVLVELLLMAVKRFFDYNILWK